jgi:hypothetical protein
LWPVGQADAGFGVVDGENLAPNQVPDADPAGRKPASITYLARKLASTGVGLSGACD